MRKSRHNAAGEVLLKRLQVMVAGAGLSSRDLARAVGAYQTQVMRVLHGDSKLDVTDFIAWCQACGTDPATEVRALTAQIKLARRR